MNRLQSINLDFVKRPVILISVAAVIVLAGVWWFAWMSPQGSKLSTVNANVAQLQQKYSQLQETLRVVEHESKLESKYAGYLATFSAAVPPTPDAPQLTTQLAALANETHVTLTSLSDDSVLAATPVSEVPINITIKGSGSQCLNFLKGIYQMDRLITISAFTPTPSDSAGSGSSVNVLSPGNAGYTFALTGDAYYYADIDQLAPSTSSATTTTAAT